MLEEFTRPKRPNRTHSNAEQPTVDFSAHHRGRLTERTGISPMATSGIAAGRGTVFDIGAAATMLAGCE
jgi:hypothetical protein